MHEVCEPVRALLFWGRQAGVCPPIDLPLAQACPALVEHSETDCSSGRRADTAVERCLILKGAFMAMPGLTSVDATETPPERNSVREAIPPPRYSLPMHARAPISSSRSPTRSWRLIGKRLIDVAGASLALFLLAPLLLVIALWIKIDSRGPVIFRQRRMGRAERPFSFLKFRTMHHDAEVQLQADPELWRLYVENACKLPADRDRRITRAGRVLRRTSLDELPQVVNVLLGHMSLVGPRPITSTELAVYGSDATALLSMRPGITGAWAVSGRSDVGYPARAHIELDYVGRWSLRTDARILLKTVPAVMGGSGAH